MKNRGWMVMLAGTGINLALGVLYSWSVISKKIPEAWGWSEAEKALPYSIACIVFALIMVPAGRIQDKIGPRWVATLGGVLTGLGLIIASFYSTVLGFVVGFGILAGSGIGFGYASATPPAVKWFPPQKTGMVAGIVVAGFGLASVYIAPTANALLTAYGVNKSMLIFGVAFLIVVCLLSQLLQNPPPGYKPEAPAAKTAVAAKPAARDYSPTELLKTPQFYLLWIMYTFAAGAGLMIIGKLAKIGQLQGNIQAGFVLVACLAIGNAGGRVIAGMMSDKIGRTRTMLLVFVFQAILMFLLKMVGGFALFIVISMLIGFNYGSNLSLFPSITKDWFGLKNFGVNYGLVFTAWGVGGFFLPYLSGWVFDKYHNFNLAYVVAGVLLLVAAALSFAVKAPADAGKA